MTFGREGMYIYWQDFIVLNLEHVLSVCFVFSLSFSLVEVAQVRENKIKQKSMNSIFSFYYKKYTNFCSLLLIESFEWCLWGGGEIAKLPFNFFSMKRTCLNSHSFP